MTLILITRAVAAIALQILKYYMSSRILQSHRFVGCLWFARPANLHSIVCHTLQIVFLKICYLWCIIICVHNLLQVLFRDSRPQIMLDRNIWKFLSDDNSACKHHSCFKNNYLQPFWKHDLFSRGKYIVVSSISLQFLLSQYHWNLTRMVYCAYYDCTWIPP